MSTDTIIGWVFIGIAALGIAVMILGCAPARLTSETLWPGDPALIVVEWPQGTAVDDVEVHEVDGRLQIVGPYRPETVY